tara:strand:+ start:1894 stop:2124 length:231 start_codon:yes stop_codon:yes gene_type:complete
MDDQIDIQLVAKAKNTSKIKTVNAKKKYLCKNQNYSKKILEKRLLNTLTDEKESERRKRYVKKLVYGEETNNERKF